MTKDKILAVLCIVILLCIGAFALVACAPKQELYIDTSSLNVAMFDDYYIGDANYNGGNTFDLESKFKNSSFNIIGETPLAELNGSKLTVRGVGELKLGVTSNKKTVQKNIYIIDGVNVTDHNQLKTTVETNHKSAVLQSDITLTANISLPANTSLYGNGYAINAEAVTKPVSSKSWGGDALTAAGNNVNIQDIHILGLDTREWTVEQKIAYDISNLERFGSLIGYRSNDFNGQKVGGTIKNIIAENGHALISLTGSSVTIEGSIFKNAADSLISVETKNNGGTKLTLKNNVFLNAVVAAVTSWGYTKANGYLDLTTEGFMDVYNWKNSSGAKLMPSSESMSSMVNGLISSELSQKKNDIYMYKLGDKKYIHVAIIILATTGLKSNNASLNGVVLTEKASNESYSLPSTDSYVLRKLPGANLANTACVIGYGNNNESKSIRITPSTKLNTDKIYEELRNGRK